MSELLLLLDALLNLVDETHELVCVLDCGEVLHVS